MYPLQDVISAHRSAFGVAGRAFQAPGRVNLIGEHTDTSEGFVLPAALDFQTIAVISPRKDTSVSIQSMNFAETVHLDLRQLPARGRQHWSDYPVGVVWSLQQHGVQCGGFDLTLGGNVPVGAGLSSSASVEVATAIAVLDHAGVGLPRPVIAQLCQRAEDQFVGAQCGIMDQFISCCGEQDRALLLDCRSLQYELLPVPSSVRLVLCNSMVRHSVAQGEYNSRRAEVAQGVQVLQRHRPEIRTLRDATEEDIAQWGAEMPENVLRRCRHVVTENGRVMAAVDAMRRNDVARLGRLMSAAHASMRDDYQASCEEADLLVELARKQPGCYGARITGAGFGGCTVNLVEAGRTTEFVRAVQGAYRQATGIEADIYVARASAGAGPCA